MAFQRGDLITAAKLNEVANSKGMVSSGRFANGDRAIGPYHLPAGGYIWFWQEQWTLPPVNAKSETYITIYKMEDGVFRAVGSDRMISKWPGGAQERTYPVSSYGGAGWYRVVAQNTRYGNWGDDGRCEIACFPWQNDCVKGEYLVYYDNYDNSGNPIPGTLLTADVLNSGRVGTRAVL